MRKEESESERASEIARASLSVCASVYLARTIQPVWLCVRLYESVRERDRKRDSERKREKKIGVVVGAASAVLL